MGRDDNSTMSDVTPAPAVVLDAVAACPLDDWGVVHAHGADARSFLHGQLTQDVLGLSEGRCRLAGYCSAKGRLLATFVVWSEGPEDVYLACSADVLAGILKRLSMFVLRARCKLRDASGDRSLFGLCASTGLVQPSTTRVLSGGLELGLLPARVDGRDVQRSLLVTPRGAAVTFARLPASQWAWNEVHSGVPRVLAATAEHFVPQMVNLELVGGVNFQKGCYPGQEVVARSQYRGTVKRRAVLLRADASARPGEEVFHSADPGQPAGEVVLSATHQGVHAVLAELKLAALREGSLHLGRPDGPMAHPVEMPYALPDPDAA
jgi:folate-binding protein YgfZ